MKQVTALQPAPEESGRLQYAEHEQSIAALEGAPEGAPLTASRLVILILLGIALPVVLLIWGWL